MDYIELRSDTMTVLTHQMRQSLTNAEYGDWTYGQDQTVKKLESYAAQLFDTQDAAYVPSGVFGNQCAILTAGKAGEEVIVRDRGHIITHQNGSIGRLARMMTRTIDCPKGYITLDSLKPYLRKKKDTQTPRTSLVILQFPTFEGLIPPIDVFHQTAQLAKSEKLHVHVDGARVFNGIAQLKIEPKSIMKYCDSMNICLSKGLCAPVGSVVVGSKQFIQRFKVNRKMMGGVMRKPGVVAASGLIALQKMRLDVWKDNQIARTLSQKLINLGWFQIVIKVQTNIIFFKIIDSSLNIPKLVNFLKQNKVICALKANSVNRFVIHRYIRQKEIQIVIGLLQKFKKQTEEEVKND